MELEWRDFFGEVDSRREMGSPPSPAEQQTPTTLASLHPRPRLRGHVRGGRHHGDDDDDDDDVIVFKLALGGTTSTPVLFKGRRLEEIGV